MIGFKEPPQEPKNRVDSKQTTVRNDATSSGDAKVFGVGNLQQGSNAEQTDTNSVSDLTQETESTKHQIGNNNKIIAIVVLVFVIAIIAIVVFSNSSKKKDNTTNSSNASNTNASQEQLYPDVSESSNFQASTEENPNAVYDEFGTGEEGLASPHPMHETTSRPLNPYNSGPYVSTHIDYTGKHYWIYAPNAGIGNYDQNGKTYGIPAGKQIYNATKEIRARKDDVIKKELNNAIRTINK